MRIWHRIQIPNMCLAPPTESPTYDPTHEPTKNPTVPPTKEPTSNPSTNPTYNPSLTPSETPTEMPTHDPTKMPTQYPTKNPTAPPTKDPTANPSETPSMHPTPSPTYLCPPVEHRLPPVNDVPFFVCPHICDKTEYELTLDDWHYHNDTDQTDYRYVMQSNCPISQLQCKPSPIGTVTNVEVGDNSSNTFWVEIYGNDHPCCPYWNTDRLIASSVPHAHLHSNAQSRSGWRFHVELEACQSQEFTLTFTGYIPPYITLLMEEKQVGTYFIRTEDRRCAYGTDLQIPNICLAPPTEAPTREPTSDPTSYPTVDPSKEPTYNPSFNPTSNPSGNPSSHPTSYPTSVPTSDPTTHPTSDPTSDPTTHPTSPPTKNPTSDPTMMPTGDPTTGPTYLPSTDPTTDPTESPTYLCPPVQHRIPPMPDIPPNVCPHICRKSEYDVRLDGWHYHNLTGQTFYRYLISSECPITQLECATGVDGASTNVNIGDTSSQTSWIEIYGNGHPCCPYWTTDRIIDSSAVHIHLENSGNTRSGWRFYVQLQPCQSRYFTFTIIGYVPPLVNPGTANQHKQLGTYFIRSDDRRCAYGTGLQIPNMCLTSPTESPSEYPTKYPTNMPTIDPTNHPTNHPTTNPTTNPTTYPTSNPSMPPTSDPTSNPSVPPTSDPTSIPTKSPTSYPTAHPSQVPTTPPTDVPTGNPTRYPTHEPTLVPTEMTCPPPKDFEPAMVNWTQCNASDSEWKITLHKWKYNKKRDLTYISYKVCTSYMNVFGSCNINEYPSKLEAFIIQIPCLCEVCIPQVTHKMKPAGMESVVYQGWLWTTPVMRGECGLFELLMHGYTSVAQGTYKMFGDGRYVGGAIDVPNPCYNIHNNPMMPPDSHEHDHDHDHTPEDGCKPRNTLEFGDMCDVMCHSDFSEWSASLNNNPAYDMNTNTTTFEYKLENMNSISSECHNDPQPMTMEYFYVRIGCQCEPSDPQLIKKMTVGMNPYGDTNAHYWMWHNVHLLPGQSKLFSITLSGDISAEYGDVLFGGYSSTDRRQYCSNKAFFHGVPNPCNNRCAFGQWTEWKTYSQCSKTCGGGYQDKYRSCVSVCDGKTLVLGCNGDSHMSAPCNTQACPGFWHRSSSKDKGWWAKGK